jgi:hypothetical protein
MKLTNSLRALSPVILTVLIAVLATGCSDCYHP